MGVEDLRPAYLSGPSVYLRALVEDDKEHAGAWLDDTFPVDATRGEKALTEEHAMTNRRTQRRLAIALKEGDEVVGSAHLASRDRHRTCTVTFTMARCRADSDALRAEALGILVHYLRDETEVMAVTVEVPADER